MATQKQIQANRRNAQLSTGPKTPEGKATASRNALKHGFSSRLGVLPEENRQDFLDLLAALRAEFQPATTPEESLVCQLAAAGWRLRRIALFETGLVTAPQFNQNTRPHGRLSCIGSSVESFMKLLRYENPARRAFYKALHQLQLVQSRRAPAASPDSPLSGPPRASATLKFTKQTQSAAPLRFPGNGTACPAPHPLGPCGSISTMTTCPAEEPHAAAH